MGDLIVLDGPLGAGKTALVRAICRELGVPVEVGIRSPTFTLINEVDGGRLPVVHADFYRVLEDPEALSELGFLELCSDSVAFAEWGASLPELASHVTVTLSLDFVARAPHDRFLEVLIPDSSRERWVPLLSALADSLQVKFEMSSS